VAVIDPSKTSDLGTVQQAYVQARRAVSGVTSSDDWPRMAVSHKQLWADDGSSRRRSSCGHGLDAC
jgi:hypothetical protein